jgi:hypothetical protein
MPTLYAINNVVSDRTVFEASLEITQLSLMMFR